MNFSLKFSFIIFYPKQIFGLKVFHQDKIPKSNINNIQATKYSQYSFYIFLVMKIIEPAILNQTSAKSWQNRLVSGKIRRCYLCD